MVVLANLKRRRAWALIALMTGMMLWVLSMPFWVEGGVLALWNGEHTGRTWWPIGAAAAAGSLGYLLIWGYRLARYKGPAYFIRDGLFNGWGLKRPIPVSEIRSVAARRGNFWFGPHPGAHVFITLADGKVRRIPTGLLDKNALSLSEGIRIAIPHLRSAAPPLS